MVVFGFNLNMFAAKMCTENILMKRIFILSLGILLWIQSLQAQPTAGGRPVSFSKQWIGYRIPEVVTPAVDLLAIRAEDALRDLEKGHPYRFGINHYQTITPEQEGDWVALPDGGRMWRVKITCPGALSVNLTFDRFRLPKGGKLFIFSEDGSDVLGALTHLNNRADGLLGCDLVMGSSMIVEYSEPAQVEFPAELSIYRITHGYRSIIDHAWKAYGDAGACQVNVNCPQGNNWQNEKRSVACIVVGGNESCTGALVNNTANDGTPYFLTANHCYDPTVATWVFRFNWESPGCANQNGPTNQTVSGAILRAKSPSSDFCLLELSAQPDPSINAYLSGWSRSFQPADSAIGIHHPSGDIMKISFADNSTQAGTYSGASTWRVGQWTLGCTEPGSSGSPLYDTHHHLVGQLFGGPSACGAAATSMYDHYGRFAKSWTGDGSASTRLRDWLDPSNIADSTLDGRELSTPLTTWNAGIQSIGAPADSSESCSNSINPSISIRNYGANAITSLTIAYRLDGQPWQNQPFTGNLPFGQTVVVNLPVFNNLSPGQHVFEARTQLPNGSADEDTLNDRRQVVFTVIVPNPQPLPIATAFAESGFPYANWQVQNPDNNNTWTLFTGASANPEDSRCLKMDNYNDAALTAGQLDVAVMPFITMPAGSYPVWLKWRYAYARFQTRKDSLFVAYSNDCGTTWNRLWAKGGTGLATNGGSSTANVFTPTASQWKADSLNLRGLLPENTDLRIGFISRTELGNNLYLDMINLQELSDVGIPSFGSERFNIQPNPSSDGRFMVTMPKNETSQIGQWRVMNLLGQPVPASISTHNLNVVIDIQNQPEGVYFFEYSGSGQKMVQKCVYSR